MGCWQDGASGNLSLLPQFFVNSKVAQNLCLKRGSVASGLEPRDAGYSQREKNVTFLEHPLGAGPWQLFYTHLELEFPQHPHEALSPVRGYVACAGRSAGGGCGGCRSWVAPSKGLVAAPPGGGPLTHTHSARCASWSQSCPEVATPPLLSSKLLAALPR